MDLASSPLRSSLCAKADMAGVQAAGWALLVFVVVVEAGAAVDRQVGEVDDMVWERRKVCGFGEFVWVGREGFWRFEGVVGREMVLR